MKFLQIFIIILLISSCASKVEQAEEAEERIKNPFGERDPNVPRKELPCERYGYRDPKLKKEEGAPWFDQSLDRVCKIKGKKCYARFVDFKDEMVCNTVLLEFLEKFKKAVAKNDPKEVAKFFDFSSPDKFAPLNYTKEEFIKDGYYKIFDRNMRYVISGIDLDYIFQFDNGEEFPKIYSQIGWMNFSSEPKITRVGLDFFIEKIIIDSLLNMQLKRK